MSQVNPNHLYSNAAISNASGGVCPTVRVKHLETDAECVINKADFDPEIHEELAKPRKRLKPADEDETGDDDKKAKGGKKDEDKK